MTSAMNDAALKRALAIERSTNKLLARKLRELMPEPAYAELRKICRDLAAVGCGFGDTMEETEPDVGTLESGSVQAVSAAGRPRIDRCDSAGTPADVVLANQSLSMERTKDVRTGSVRMWNSSKGFGFIAPSEGGKDIFVHATGLLDGEKELFEGDRVSFEVTFDKNKNKDRCVQVRIL